MASETAQDKMEGGEYDQHALEACPSTLYNIYSNKDGQTT